MVSIELSEAAVEFNCILEYTEEKLKKKIPQNFLDFLKEIQSNTYKFEYDKNKRLSEQNLKPKTRGLIALVYKDYICDEDEKKEYLRIIQEKIMQKEVEKRKIYNPDDLFKNKDIVKNEELQQSEEKRITMVKEEKWYIKLFDFIKNLFHSGK